MEDETLPRPSSASDRLAGLLRGNLTPSNDSVISPMTPELGSHLISQLRSTSHRTQIYALRTLIVLIQHTTFILKDCPLNFIPDLISIFVREITDHEIRVTLLHVIDLLCGKSREFLSVFSDCSFYHLLFEKGTSPRSIFSLHLWLPVLDHFLRWSGSAFAYFSADHVLLNFLDSRRKHCDGAIDLEFIVSTLSVYASSPFFNGSSDPNSIFLLVRISLEILSPDYLLKPTHLTGYAIRILGCCLYKLQEGEHIREVINRNIAILIVNLITPDNLQLAVDCSFFVSLGSYCSKAICFQLSEADVFNVLSSALLSESVFQECGLNCLNTIYNCLVECPLKASEAFESRILHDVLMKAIDRGKAKVKQTAIEIVCFGIATAQSDSKVIEWARGFKLYEQIPLFIELGLRDTIPSVLTAANRIINALTINPQEVDTARTEMVNDDVIEALLTFLESPGNPQTQEYANFYLIWARSSKS
jgi:hypothetical protein